MISVREARSLQQRLARGERITLHAVVRARNDDAMPYETRGRDDSRHRPRRRRHRLQLPSGSREAGRERQRQRLLREPRNRADAEDADRREAHSAADADDQVHLAVGDDRDDRVPDRSTRTSRRAFAAAVHLDMVGGDPFITKSVLHVTRSPWSIATVTDDVEEVFGRYVIDGAMRAAGEGDMSRAIRSAAAPKDAFWADITPYESGSDHWIYQEGAFRDPVDLPARSSRHLHPHHRRSARQHRADEDQAVGVHRRRQRLLPGDDAGPRRRRCCPELRQRPGAPGAKMAGVPWRAMLGRARDEAAIVVGQGVLREQRRMAVARDVRSCAIRHRPSISARQSRRHGHGGC